MNQIANVWSAQKDKIAIYHPTIATMETVRQAKATLVWMWEEFPHAIIDTRCPPLMRNLNAVSYTVETITLTASYYLASRRMLARNILAP